MKTRLQRWIYALVLMIVVVLPLKAIAEMTMTELKNAEYYTVNWDTKDRLDKKKMRLVNGEYEMQGPNGVMDTESLSSGKIALGDLTGDGKTDGVVILYHNTGGSGTVSQVAAVIDVNGQPRHIASRNLGDRTEIKNLTVEKGFIVITLDNPRFYPGQKKTVKYRLVGNKLIGPEPFK